MHANDEEVLHSSTFGPKECNSTTPGLKLNQMFSEEFIQINIYPELASGWPRVSIDGKEFPCNVNSEDLAKILDSYVEAATIFTDHIPRPTNLDCKNFVLNEFVPRGVALGIDIFGTEGLSYLRELIVKRTARKTNLNEGESQEEDADPIRLHIASSNQVNVGWIYWDTADSARYEPNDLVSAYHLFSGFWGFQFEIIHLPICTIKKANGTVEYGPPQRPQIIRRSKPAVGLVVDKNFDEHARREHKALDALFRERRITIHEFNQYDSFDPTAEVYFRTALGGFLCDTDLRHSAIHISCEIVYSDRDVLATYMSFRPLAYNGKNDYKFRLLDLKLIPQHIQADVVFINGCWGGITNNRVSLNFPNTFKRYGAKVIICSPLPVHSRVSVDIAVLFYEYWTDDPISVEYALYKVKRTVLKETKQLAQENYILLLNSLFYTVYGFSNIIL